MTPTVHIRHFTDPSCPWAFSAEPHRLHLAWRFGESIEWQTTLVVLSERGADVEAAGFTTDVHAGALRSLQRRFGMPISGIERPRMAGSAHACRAIVGTRLHQPDREEALLRALRVIGMGGGLIDEPLIIREAADRAGVHGGDLLRWAEEEKVGRLLDEDRAAARNPSAAARALDHKLGGPSTERRYTCPSYELSLVEGDATFSLPGFQSFEAYLAAIANLAPELEGRPDPETVDELLAWAPYPLASAEVAELMGVDIEDARDLLADAGANLLPTGADGYWSPGA